MDYRSIFSRRRSAGQAGGEDGGDMGRMLLVTARPGIQVFWTVVVAATLLYTLTTGEAESPWAVALTAVSYAAVMTGNHFFPYRKYRPFAFFLLMCSCLVLIASIVYLTGNRESILSFLFFVVPIFAASYFSYPGTVLVAVLTALARYVPFVTYEPGGMVQFSLALSAFSYLVVGVLACYVFEGQRMYARESAEYRHLLQLALDKERDVSLIYNLSRKFSYTLDLDNVLKTTAALARRMLSADGSLVFLVEDGAPRLKAALGMPQSSDLSQVALPADENWVTRLEGGESVTAEGVSLSWLGMPAGADRGYDLWAVPLFAGGETVGYLVCYAGSSREAAEAHLEVLTTLASQAAAAVEKARLYSNTLDEKRKVETILFALRDGLLVTDSSGVLVQANPVALQMLGADSEALGRELLDVLGGPLLASDLGGYGPAEAVAAVLEGHTIFGEMELAADSRVHVQAQFIPLEGQMGEVSGLVLFLHDITELKRVDEMKSNFVSNVSHELRTPLTSISGFVRLMLAGRAGQLNAQQKQYLEVVSEQAANLTGMIESLLDLSRLQARSVKAEMQEVDIAGVVETAARDLRGPASEKDVEIRTRVPASLPKAQADPGRVLQVLVNVIGNAVKFSEPGGLIEVSASHSGPLLQVKVSDNGPGIPPSALPHIFDRFFQARTGEVPEQGGFGLGLAISREIVEMHGGKIWAESDVGRGSTFYFTLPVHG